MTPGVYHREGKRGVQWRTQKMGGRGVAGKIGVSAVLEAQTENKINENINFTTSLFQESCTDFMTHTSQIIA
ncbi:hypothetical protein Y032_0087g2025 [Ancylostoma ceylanicum]|uniref:Uncharacterized protein n=1 Tax=Ancylostoma ceylanicum TaxID=53326 RepID=A0A016TPU7_9BILA|nr:hypothetical protein Y032_0087g2025 [Ancylostoma ceylanicum]